jgi:hypothetical protein
VVGNPQIIHFQNMIFIAHSYVPLLILY